jgi:hypothetical protein
LFWGRSVTNRVYGRSVTFLGRAGSRDVPAMHAIRKTRSAISKHHVEERSGLASRSGSRMAGSIPVT